MNKNILWRVAITLLGVQRWAHEKHFGHSWRIIAECQGVCSLQRCSKALDCEKVMANAYF
jgi:hypothetical protein